MKLFHSICPRRESLHGLKTGKRRMAQNRGWLEPVHENGRTPREANEVITTFHSHSPPPHQNCGLPWFLFWNLDLATFPGLPEKFFKNVVRVTFSKKSSSLLILLSLGKWRSLWGSRGRKIVPKNMRSGANFDPATSTNRFFGTCLKRWWKSGQGRFHDFYSPL